MRCGSGLAGPITVGSFAEKAAVGGQENISRSRKLRDMLAKPKADVSVGSARPQVMAAMIKQEKFEKES